MPQFKSSNVRSATYNAESNEMTVKFRRQGEATARTYVYTDVEKAFFNRLVAAKSKGAFMRRNGHSHDYERI